MSAVDYFMKIDDITGESQDAKHKGSIEIESWSWGESQMGTHSDGSGGGAGRVQMQDFHFVMKINQASPKLILACATGEHFKKAVLICRKAGKEQQEFLKIEMDDLLVSSYHTGGSGHTDIIPTDQISLNYGKIHFEYREQKQDGSLGGAIRTGYDLRARKNT